MGQKQADLGLHCFQNGYIPAERSLLSSADNHCKQFGSKLFNTLIVFLKDFFLKKFLCLGVLCLVFVLHEFGRTTTKMHEKLLKVAVV